MQLPPKLLDSLDSVKGFDREAFVKVHNSGAQITSIRLNPSKKVTEAIDFPWQTGFRIPWSSLGYYLEERPSFTFDPLFHAGCYYVQEASGMFIEQALRQTTDLNTNIKILDLCAAPGGKSTHLQSLVSKNSLLVSNEVIGSRVNVLKDNIIKWGCGNVMVTQQDPKGFAALENYFDVMLVDAPCSGSGLFRRDEKAIEEWSPNLVKLCSQRQQRILADALPALKKNGILIYATCSYSPEENEEIVDWLIKELDFTPCPLTLDPSWNITEVKTGEGGYSYRFFPDKLKGEGFFLACLRKKEGEKSSSAGRMLKLEKLNKNELEILNEWVGQDGWTFLKKSDKVIAWPEKLVNEFARLSKDLRIIYSGVLMGQLVRDKFIPDHALAQSGILHEGGNRIDLTREEAIIYLQKKEFHPEICSMGWHLVTFEAQGLGWIKVLANRVNNYYPGTSRILKDS